MDEKKLARYNLGRQFYQDHLSAIGLYDTLPKVDEYVGFTDAAVIGFLDMLSDDIRTMQERYPASSWHELTEFCPPGMQIKRPNGLSFDLNGIESMTSLDNLLVITFKNMSRTEISFHRNVDGGPPAIYKLRDNIGAAIKMLNTTAVFVKPDTLEHRSASGELLGRIPGSMTTDETYAERFFKEKKDREFRLNHDPQYREGWNAAIDHILKLSEKWMYHTGSEESPYHLRCIDDEKRRELLMLKRE